MFLTIISSRVHTFELRILAAEKSNLSAGSAQKNNIEAVMGTIHDSPVEVYTSDSEKGFGINPSTSLELDAEANTELDAGAKFVLISRGADALPIEYSIYVALSDIISMFLAFFIMVLQ